MAWMSRALDTIIGRAKSSNLLFNKDCLLAFMFQSFSSRHKLHCFPPLLYTVAYFVTDHSILKGQFLSLRFQTCFESPDSLCVTVWNLKLKNRPFKTDWSAIKHATVYRNGKKQCNLCQSKENLWITKANKQSLLNKNSGLISRCHHESKFSISNNHHVKKKVMTCQTSHAL